MAILKMAAILDFFKVAPMLKLQVRLQGIIMPKMAPLSIVLCKMFSRWFLPNEKLIMTIRTLKFGDVTYNVMS